MHAAHHYTIQYKPGKHMILADCLMQFLSAKESLPILVHQNIQHVQLSTHRLNAVCGAIEHDLVCSILYWLTLRGWPDCLRLVLRIAWHYWGTWNELSLEANIVLKGNCICIPPELLDRTLADLHSTHQGIEKNAGTSLRNSILARHRCWHHQLHHEMCHLYLT